MSSSRSQAGKSRRHTRNYDKTPTSAPSKPQTDSSSSTTASVLSAPQRTPHGRLMPDPTIHGPSKLTRMQTFFERFITNDLTITNGDVAKSFLRAVLRQCGEPNATEKCITELSAIGCGLFALSDALSYNTHDEEFLNKFVGQFFLFLGHKYKAKDKDLDLISYDDMIRLIMGRMVTESIDLFKGLADATRKDRLTPETIEGFAWFLKEYLEFAADVPPHIEEIVSDKVVLEKFYKASQAEIRLIGYRLKYLLDCDGVNKHRKAGGYAPGGRHDNDFDDYRQIRIIPTPDEIHSTDPPFLTKSPDALKRGGDARIGSHLDCQFRLLREEMLNEIRADYHEFIKGQKVGLTTNHNSERSKLVLEGLEWGGWDFECCIKFRKFGIRLTLPSGFADVIDFQGASYNQLLEQDQSFPYKNNSMSCLVVGNEIAGFPILSRDVECLREDPPCIILTFDGKKAIEFAMTKLWWALIYNTQDNPQIKLICVDTPVFAHEPVLKRLQQMRTIPLANELIHYRKGNKILKTSFHPEQPAKYITPNKPLRDIVKGGTMMSMDSQQCKAILRALQDKVALIQGPPGTGKTMVGNIIAKLFYLYTDERILVITHQNHICDEFTENLLEMGVNQEHVVRLGSQYNRNTRCVSLNEISDEKDLLNSAKEIIEALQETLQCAWLLIEEAYVETFVHPMQMRHVVEVAKLYNEPNPQDPVDPFGYVSAFTVPQQWIDIVLKADPEAQVMGDNHLFQIWSTNDDCPLGMSTYMTEKGRRMWEMPPEKRQRLFSWFRESTMLDQVYGIADAATVYNKVIDEMNTWKGTRVRDVMLEKRVIAATTTGAAKHLTQIAQVAPRIIIVEEAAQILESHVLAALHQNVEQLILIGDHKQLRPRCDTYELQFDSKKGYDLDVSLFERLVNSHFPLSTLDIQHRARPEIANIIRTLTYPDLRDAHSVHRYDGIRGLQSNMFWLHHSNAESSATDISKRASTVLKKSSKINEFEANMVVSIIRYLGANGYSSDHIAVITPYLGQVGLITKFIRQKSEFDVILSQMDYHELVRAGLMEARDASGITKYVEVCTVDQFQGSDRDIIIVSMVRSNKERNIGFLKSPERANVMLSRARKCLIILGDLYTAIGKPEEGVNMWSEVAQMFTKEERIYIGFPIVCQKHSDQKYICTSPEMLDYRSPEGRCRMNCGAPLQCKIHTCPFYCHSGDDHNSMPCEQIVTKKCGNGHEWDDSCWSPQPKPCEKCKAIEAHFQAIQDEEDIKKTQEFERSLAVEKKLKQQAEEKERLDIERRKTLDRVTNERLVAEGKLESTAKRTKPYVRPFGDAQVREIAEAENLKRKQEDKELTATQEIKVNGSSSTSSSSIRTQTKIMVTSDIDIIIEEHGPMEPRIRMDDDSSSEGLESSQIPDISKPEFDIRRYKSLEIPSSPPIRFLEPESPSEEDEVPPAQSAATERALGTVVVEEFGDKNIQRIPHVVPNPSAIIEEPSTFVENISQVKEISAVAGDNVPDTNINILSISLPILYAGSNTSKAQKNSITSKPNNRPTSDQFQFAPEIKSTMPFPSLSRDEWLRQKEVSKDSNIALDKIMDMIGMEHVKERVLAIKAKAETVRRQGIDLRDERFHIALLGNPGTGKTTFARLYANFLRSEGILEGANCIETTGAMLASEGIPGIQAHFTNLLLVRGGILFIDEAYQLVTTGALEGRQVLDFLLSEMEKNLGKIVVIISGYNKEMEKFFEHNPGLNSRIPYRVQFEDFTNDELLYILQDVLKRKFNGRMRIEDGYNGLYLKIVSQRLGRMRGMLGCGNARAVQNTIAKILERQAARLTNERKLGLDTDDFCLMREDIIGFPPTKAAMDSPAWKELHQLIGLSAVKESVSVLLKRMERNYQRELAQERPIDISLNRVFLGSPGTGKTSVAKIYGKILAQLGLLSSGEVIMKTPSDFLGRALGESEANTKAILNATRGKVLIIDEAYMFTPKLNGSEDPYKAAVIDTIVSEVQNVPGDDQCVLLLGYKEDLEKMFKAVNPGLSRRFPIADGFTFEDFTDEELSRILALKLRLAELHASQEAREVAIQKISQKRQKPNFGNAGEVENLLNVAKERMLMRQIDGDDLQSELLLADFDPDHDRANRANTDLQDLFKDLIGVDDVMHRFEEYQTTAMMMRGRGVDPREQIPTLFIFKGPPGTGKTTTARKMGQIFYNMSFLASNEVVECSASDLIAEYLGQTAQKTRQKLESALGKVLFIDEAYRLQDNQYGTEASNELVDAVTKPKYMGKLVVILAGYDEGMDRLLTVNVGLASRFSEVIDFPDVDYATAIEILKLEVVKNSVAFPTLDNTESAEYQELMRHMEEITKTPGWGHARDALNLARSMVSAAFRVVKTVDGPVAVTQQMALKVMMDMLRQRKGRAFQMPQVAQVAQVTKTPMPTTSPAFAAVEYQELKQEPAPKVNYNIQTADIYKAQEASIHGSGSAAGSTSHTDDSISIRNMEEDEIPRHFQQVNDREPGASDEDWRTLLQWRDWEEVQYNVGLLERSKLRRHLSNSQKFLKQAASAVAELLAKRERHPKACGNIEFQMRLGGARVKEKNARKAVEEMESKLEGLVENEKLKVAVEKLNLVKLDRMGLCPKRYHWIRVSGGYRCGGGEHFVAINELATYSME
ncbi:hypothetical protein ABW20_dc0107429 [Dactylellina cionopaga]|nr:hypothetical protein ABW20_dc0107429 [Dactylellina cionopaga]